MAGRWLTPDTPPRHKQWTRLVHMPAALDFIAPVSGALLAMTYPSNWEQHGTLTPEETAAIYSDIYQQFLDFQNEPPDWTSPDDLDGQPEQPWYEQLADWIIAGFLAYTFTYQAAIVYTTTVPKLRVAFRTGNIGALFRVLINGIEVWTGDSYDVITDVIEQIFDMSAETEPYTVRIEHNGIGAGHGLTEAKLEYIRQGALADMVATILRADPNGCGVQWSTDDGGTWNTVDLSTCIAGIADDRIIQAIEDGTIPPISQPGPTNRPDPDTCVTYHVALKANDKWMVPLGIQTGDTIHVTNPVGGWNDGTLAWYCGDGARYLFGSCSQQLHIHEGGDPDSNAWHMGIIGMADGFTFDPIADTFTFIRMPANGQVWLQANDDSLGDNSGTIEFDVTICAHANLAGCYEFDFTTGEHHWAIYNYPSTPTPYGTYVAGEGYEGTANGSDLWLSPRQDASLGAAFHCDYVEIDTYNDVEQSMAYLTFWNSNISLFGHELAHEAGENTTIFSWGVNWPSPGDPLWIACLSSDHLYLRRIRFIGSNFQPDFTTGC